MCQTTPAATTPLPPQARAPRLARGFLRRAMCPEHHRGVLADAELLTSELVTNALVHGAPPIALGVECDTDGGVRVRVSDGSPRLPLPRSAGPADLDGRGMALVQLLAEAWGAEPDGAGKAVWFVLLPRTDARALGGAGGA